MEFFENVMNISVEGCQCDDHCGSDSWGCDNDNEGWHSDSDD